jgi:hypothetical protein
MAATVARQHLSGSTSGRPFNVTATSQATAITVHTAVAGAAPNFDEIYLCAANTTAASISLNVQINDGSIVDPDDYYIKGMVIPANSGEIPVLNAVSLNGGLEVEAWASATGITLHGYVNRLS